MTLLEGKMASLGDPSNGCFLADEFPRACQKPKMLRANFFVDIETGAWVWPGQPCLNAVVPMPFKGNPELGEVPSRRSGHERKH